MAFATKLELAVGLVLDLPVPPNLIVLMLCDGAYAKKKFVQPVWASGGHVLSSTGFTVGLRLGSGI